MLYCCSVYICTCVPVFDINVHNMRRMKKTKRVVVPFYLIIKGTSSFVLQKKIMHEKKTLKNYVVARLLFTCTCTVSVCVLLNWFLNFSLWVYVKSTWIMMIWFEGWEKITSNIYFKFIFVFFFYIITKIFSLIYLFIVK